MDLTTWTLIILLILVLVGAFIFLYFKTNIFKKKPQTIKTDDMLELKEIERKAYVEAAKLLASDRGREKAKNDYTTIKKKNDWDLN